MERVAAGVEESVRRILETAAVCVIRSAIDALHVREDLEEPLAELPKQNIRRRCPNAYRRSAEGPASVRCTGGLLWRSPSLCNGVLFQIHNPN